MAGLDFFEHRVLTPEAIGGAIREAQKRVWESLKKNPDKPGKLTAEIKKLERQLRRFEDLIANDKAPDMVLAAIRDREDRIKALTGELQNLAQPENLGVDAVELLRDLEDRLAQFRELLLSNTPRARQVLSKLLAGPLWFDQCDDGSYEVTGETHVEPLLPISVTMASPRGVEPLLPA